MGYRLATKDDVGKMVYVTDYPDDRPPLSRKLRAYIEDGGKKYVVANTAWEYAYIEVPDYHTPTTSDIGKMVEVRTGCIENWVERVLVGIYGGYLFCICDGKKESNRAQCAYPWDQARIKD